MIYLSFLNLLLAQYLKVWRSSFDDPRISGSSKSFHMCTSESDGSSGSLANFRIRLSSKWRGGCWAMVSASQSRILWRRCLTRGLRPAMPGRGSEGAGLRRSGHRQHAGDHVHDLSEVFDSLCRAAAGKVQDLNALNLANTLWTMAKTSRVLPEVFDSLCQAAAAKVQDLNALSLANTLWTSAKTSRVLPEVFDSLCQAVAAKVRLNALNPANTLWTMAKTSRVLPEEMRQAAAATVQAFNTQGLANTLWAMATVRVSAVFWVPVGIEEHATGGVQIRGQNRQRSTEPWIASS